MRNQKLPAMLRSFIPLAVAITLMAGLLYVTAQQILRQGANDPQVEMASTAAASLGLGVKAAGVPKVDIATSDAPYLIIFDDQGRPVDGTGVLHGQLPTVPQGSLTYARDRGENRVTWQPEPGVRSATVIVPVKGGAGGYVLAGRSLREVEQRTGQLQQLILAGWLATLVVTLAATIVAGL